MSVSEIDCFKNIGCVSLARRCRCFVPRPSPRPFLCGIPKPYAFKLPAPVERSLVAGSNQFRRGYSWSMFDPAWSSQVILVMWDHHLQNAGSSLINLQPKHIWIPGIIPFAIDCIIKCSFHRLYSVSFLRFFGSRKAFSLLTIALVPSFIRSLGVTIVTCLLFCGFHGLNGLFMFVCLCVLFVAFLCESPSLSPPLASGAI